MNDSFYHQTARTSAAEIVCALCWSALASSQGMFGTEVSKLRIDHSAQAGEVDMVVSKVSLAKD